MNKVSFKKSRQSEKDYFLWRQERAKQVLARIDKLKKLKELKILDFGCGYGSLTKILLDHQAKVTAVDIDPSAVITARCFIKAKRGLKIFQVRNGQLPLPNDSFDIVFLFDVIEHVKRPEFTIKQCLRVLKPGGILYIEFTPYYGLLGHHLYDFTKLPIHFLPKKYQKRLIFNKHASNKNNFQKAWSQFEELNKLKIRELQKLVANLFKINEEFIVKYPGLFEAKVPFANRLGPFKDLFTMSFIGIYRKV